MSSTTDCESDWSDLDQSDILVLANVSRELEERECDQQNDQFQLINGDMDTEEYDEEEVEEEKESEVNGSTDGTPQDNAPYVIEESNGTGTEDGATEKNADEDVPVIGAEADQSPIDLMDVITLWKFILIGLAVGLFMNGIVKVMDSTMVQHLNETSRVAVGQCEWIEFVRENCILEDSGEIVIDPVCHIKWRMRNEPNETIIEELKNWKLTQARGTEINVDEEKIDFEMRCILLVVVLLVLLVLIMIARMVYQSAEHANEIEKIKAGHERTKQTMTTKADLELQKWKNEARLPMGPAEYLVSQQKLKEKEGQLQRLQQLLDTERNRSTKLNEEWEMLKTVVEYQKVRVVQLNRDMMAMKEIAAKSMKRMMEIDAIHSENAKNAKLQEKDKEIENLRKDKELLGRQVSATSESVLVYLEIIERMKQERSTFRGKFEEQTRKMDEEIRKIEEDSRKIEEENQAIEKENAKIQEENLKIDEENAKIDQSELENLSKLMVARRELAEMKATNEEKETEIESLNEKIGELNQQALDYKEMFKHEVQVAQVHRDEIKAANEESKKVQEAKISKLVFKLAQKQKEIDDCNQFLTEVNRLTKNTRFIRK